MKYIVVTGGVISGLGKGTVASSIGLLLRAYGFRVTAIKIDPYLNFDSGLHSPFEHGECYVLDDGSECDLDLGNYERFLGINLSGKHSLTSGKVFKSVIDRERAGYYLGQTVQMVPHVTDFIKEWIMEASELDVGYGLGCNDICIVELGGTVGDYEGSIYYESLSDLPGEVCYVHVSLVPMVGSDEIKTKPTQHSIRALRSLGIDPDVLVLRCGRELTLDELCKVSRFCKLDKDNIIVNQDVGSIYEVPRLFLNQKMLTKLKVVPSIEGRLPNFSDYNSILAHISGVEVVGDVRIGVVGKYVGINDTYLSMIRALEHASFKVKKSLKIDWIDSELSKDELSERVLDVDGVVIPGGFGVRGIEGMIHVAELCRTLNIPLLGLCLGMHVMCIELDRNVLGNVGASSEEFSAESERKTVVLSDEVTVMGASMRLGSYRCKLLAGSKVRGLYGKEVVSERHRHRYEISGEFVRDMESCKEFVFSGVSVDGRYMEVLEGKTKSYYVGCQFHPEYKSRHSVPHPLFVGLLSA